MGKLFDGIQTIAIAGDPFRCLFSVPEGQILEVGNIETFAWPGKIDAEDIIVMDFYLFGLR